jgi:hypothetical protein
MKHENTTNYERVNIIILLLWLINNLFVSEIRLKFICIEFVRPPNSACVFIKYSKPSLLEIGVGSGNL